MLVAAPAVREALDDEAPDVAAEDDEAPEVEAELLAVFEADAVLDMPEHYLFPHTTFGNHHVVAWRLCPDNRWAERTENLHHF